MELGLATKLSESELANRSKTDRANYSLGFQTTELYPRVRDTTVEFTVQAITEATGIKAPPRAKSAP